MIIIPAIDIRAGSCVRLTRGDPNQQTVYSSDPVQVAHAWVKRGAKRIHVVDLDGALNGYPVHLEIVSRIKKEAGCEVQFGGGLRESDSAEKALRMGIDKLILGTVALEEREWVRECLQTDADRFMVSLDSMNNQVTKHGWQSDGKMTLDDALARMESLGFRETIFTDISRDGTLEGPNVEATARMVGKTRMGVYASGGVSSLDDIKKLKTIPDLKGVVVGKALYAGKVTLEDCLAL